MISQTIDNKTLAPSQIKQCTYCGRIARDGIDELTMEVIGFCTTCDSASVDTYYNDEPMHDEY